MGLPYKIKIKNALLVKIGYTSLMIFTSCVFSFFAVIITNLNKIDEVIKMIIIISTIIISIGRYIYRLFTEVEITETTIFIRKPLNKKIIKKSDIIGYQGGLHSVRSNRSFIDNYFYSKCVFTDSSRDVIYIEDNSSAKYFAKNDQVRVVEVIKNFEMKLEQGLYIKPDVVFKIYTLLYLILTSVCVFSIWSLLQEKINKIDGIIIFVISLVLLFYGIGKCLINIYVFIIQKTKIVLQTDGIQFSNRWSTKYYKYTDIVKANKRFFGLKYNSLLKLIVGKYLFNGNSFVTDRVFG